MNALKRITVKSQLEFGYCYLRVLLSCLLLAPGPERFAAIRPPGGKTRGYPPLATHPHSNMTSFRTSWLNPSPADFFNNLDELTCPIRVLRYN